jgi:hypothetical protein
MDRSILWPQGRRKKTIFPARFGLLIDWTFMGSEISVSKIGNEYLTKRASDEALLLFKKCE